MKTITTLLLTSFLLAGTFNTVFAGDDSQKENAPRQRNEIKVKRETKAVRSSDSRGTTRTTTERKTEVQLPSRNQNREIKVRTTEVRQVQSNKEQQTNRNVRPEQPNRNDRPSADARQEQNNRNEQSNRDVRQGQTNREVRQEQSNRNERSTAGVSRNENIRGNQSRIESRGPERRPDFNRRANISYRERQLRCGFCTGRGFTLHLDGFRHLRCNHCEGRGIRVYREMHVNACGVCYDPLHNQNLGCSLEELAWMETNRLVVALELSDHQRNRIFDINFRYIRHHYNGDNYSTSRRDREIRRILRLGQIVAYAFLLNELRNGDLCYNCTNIRY